MKDKANKDLLMDATMRIVAENGLLSFSMRQATKAVGVSEALIYRHYETKENLLFQCYLNIDKQIAALLPKGNLPKLQSDEETYAYFHSIWMNYFSFLVKKGYKTLYYFEYRESPYIAKVKENGESSQITFIKNYDDIVNVDDFAKTSTDDYKFLWDYVTDISGIFARRIIRGELPDNVESYERTWRLIYSGVSWYLK